MYNLKMKCHYWWTVGAFYRVINLPFSTPSHYNFIIWSHSVLYSSILEEFCWHLWNIFKVRGGSNNSLGSNRRVSETIECGPMTPWYDNCHMKKVSHLVKSERIPLALIFICMCFWWTWIQSEPLTFLCDIFVTFCDLFVTFCDFFRWIEGGRCNLLIESCAERGCCKKCYESCNCIIR